MLGAGQHIREDRHAVHYARERLLFPQRSDDAEPGAAGLLGELLHCEVGYQHFVRGSQFTKNGDLTWRGIHALERNGNHYPTHAIGRSAWWMNINRGDRFTYLNSMSSNSRGPNLFAA